MDYRHTDILAEKTFTSTGTEDIEIKVKEPISRLYIRGRATNPATRATIIAHPSQLMTKIELIDGSDVLYSLSGQQGQALNHYEMNQTPDTEVSDGGDEVPHATVLINFGRKLWDRQFFLDPARFKDLRLKITHNYLAYCASSTNFKLLVKADVMNGSVGAPQGFLMSKTLKSYTSSASANEYARIPTDHPFRRIILQSYLTNKAINSTISKFKLSEDNDKRILIDSDIDEYVRYMMTRWTPMLEHFALRIQTTATSVFVMPTYWPYLFGEWSQHNYAITRVTYTEAERQSLTSATNGSYPWFGTAYGYIPHHCIDFPFGDPDEPDSWWDVTKAGYVEAKITAAATGSSAVAVIGQQLRKY